MFFEKLMFIFILDPSEDQDEEFGGKLSQNKVHIRIQQRNGRKTITTLQGIEEKYDQKKLAKAFKKVSVNLSKLGNYIIISIHQN